MKEYLFLLVFAIFSLPLCAQKSKQISSVQFKIKLKAQIQQTDTASTRLLHARYKVSKVEALFPQSDKFAARHAKYGLQRWYLLSVDSVASDEMMKIIAAYQSDPNVEVAEPVVQPSVVEPVKSSKPVKSVKREGNESFPNDVLFSQQWALKNTSNPGADIDIRRAWTIQKGDPSVIVAVIDCGVDCSHPDLRTSLWTNSAEASGVAGVDDDGNGFVDDIHGWNFTYDTCYIKPIEHGTHVAGVIAATTNNGIGIAGIAGGDGSGNGVRVMSCQVFGDGPFDARGGHERAFVYAADNGAVIAQNSWGADSPTYFGQSVLDAIDYFIENAGYDVNGNPAGPMQGGLVVFSAGNEGKESMIYPGGYKEVIAVASSESTDKIASYSNYGVWVDITAPGSDILSSVPNSTYKNLSGTSMAAPQVSGLAALIVSQFKDSGITPAQVRNRILGMADYIEDKNPTFKHKHGAGRINAYKSLLPASTNPPSTITDLRCIASYQLSASIVWTTPTATVQDTISTVAEYECRYSTQPITAENFDNATAFDMSKPLRKGILDTIVITGLESDTVYYVAIKTVDAFSNKSALSNVATFRTVRAPKAVLSHTELNVTLRPNRDTIIEITILNAGRDTLQIVPYYQNQSIIAPEILRATLDSSDQQPIMYTLTDNSNTTFLTKVNAINGKVYSKVLSPLIYNEDELRALAYDGNYFYMARAVYRTKSMIYIFNRQLQLVDSIQTPRLKIFNGLTVGNGKLYLLDNLDNCVWEIDIRTKAVMRKIMHDMFYPWGIAFDQNQNTIFVSHDELRVIDMKRAYVTAIYSSKPYFHLTYSMPMNVLAAENSTQNVIALINPVSREELLTIPRSEEVTIALQQQNSVKEWMQERHTDTILAFGKSQTIRLHINTSNMNTGMYFDRIFFKTNDPSRQSFYMPVQLTVAELPLKTQPQVTLSTDTITFYRYKGKLFDSALVTITNTGSATLSIGGMACLDSSFSLRRGVLSIDAGKSEQVWITRDASRNDDFITHLLICSNNPEDAYQRVVVRTKDAPQYYTVSGKINGVSAVAISLDVTGDTTFTSTVGVNGLVQLLVHPRQNITVTPRLQGYTFEPASRTISDIQADISGLNFSAHQNTAINEQAESVITIFPNPTKDKCTISGLRNIEMLTLTSINGVEVLKKAISSDVVTIDLQNVPSGVYSLKLFEKGQTIEYKIIKN